MSGSPGPSACFFFFQAEDGIRDRTVTGVQTCALPISGPRAGGQRHGLGRQAALAVARDLLELHLTRVAGHRVSRGDRKSTRLNSSHRTISYAVFCLKKKKKINEKNKNPLLVITTNIFT